MYDKNDEPWHLEAHLASIANSEERARTRREFGGLGYDEGGAPAYVPSFGSGPQARLNRAIGGPDDDVNLDDGPTLDELVAMPSPTDGEACEVDFYTGKPLVPPSMVRPQDGSSGLSEDELERRMHVFADRACRELTDRLHEHPPGVPSRPGVLAQDVPRLYDAFSFLNFQRGVTLNTFLTVSYEALAVFDHRDAMELHGRLNDKLQNWLGVGLIAQMPGRRRVSARAQLGSSEHFYGYVVENGSKLRFHVHQLMWVPATTQFNPKTGRHIYKATWMKHALRRWLAKQVGCKFVPDEVVDVKYHAPRSPDEDLRWQWDRFRYMAKCLGKNVAYPDGKGGLVSARELFKLDAFRQMRPVFCAQLSGGSHNIWTREQREAGFVSAFGACEDDRLYSDWTLRAYAERVEAARRAAEFDEILRSLWDWDLNRRRRPDNPSAA